MGGKLHRVFLLVLTFLPSAIRVRLLRLLGHQIGNHVHVSILTVLVAASIRLDDDVRIGPLNIVWCGQDVRLGYGAEISFMVIIYGRRHFHLGARSYVSVQTFIDTEGGVTIGRYSGTGPRTMIFTHAIFLPPSKGYPRVVRPTEIGDYVWLGGMNFLSAGAKVGNNVITVPGAVITKPVGPNVFWASAKRQIPMERMCQKMEPAKLVALARDIVNDFAESYGYSKVERGDCYEIGGKVFVITDAPQPGLENAAVCLLADASARPSRGAWYNLATLECSDGCTGRFHERFQTHCRKYFGMHFIPKGTDEDT